MSWRAAVVLSAFIHLAVLMAVHYATVVPDAPLRLPSGTLKVDVVQAVRPTENQDRKPSQAADRPVLAAGEKQPDRASPQKENQTGTASSRPAGPEDETPASPPAGFPVPNAPAPPPDAFARAMTPLMYSQLLTTMAVRYVKTTHALVLVNLETALAVDLVRELDGEQATIAVVYADKNELRSFTVNAKNEVLRNILESEIPWNTIPAPGSLSLPYREVLFHVSLERGKVYLRLSPSPEKPKP